MNCIQEGDHIDLRKCWSCDKFTCYESGKVNCSMNKAGKDKKSFDRSYTLARYYKDKRIIKK